MQQKAPDVAEVLAGESRRTRGRRFVVWGLAAALAAAVLLGWWWFSGASQSTAKRYVTEAATRADIRETVVATGTLEPTGEAEVSSTISGTIASVDVDANDRVSKGQILARLEMGDLEAGLARAIAMVESQRANLLAAEANLADADAALKRTQALSAGQSVSVRELELAGTAAKRAQAQLAVAQAQLRGAEADLQGARNDYAKSCICSPIDGIVMEVNADVGQSITTSSLGKSLFSIAEDLSRLDLLVDIDEADIGKVGQDNTATFTVEAWPDRQFSGVIRQIRYAPVVAEGVVSYRAVLSVDNADLALRPGMTATADIVVAEASNVLTVPNAALRFTPETDAGGGGIIAGMMPSSSVETEQGRLRSVWVLRDGELAEVQVTIGLTDGQRTQITGDALTEGDQVAVAMAAR